MKTKTVKVNIKSRDILPKFSNEDLAILAQRIGMTADQLKRYGIAAYRTYGAIGAYLSDVNNGKAMKRRDLIEVVLDADDIGIYGRLDPDLVEWRANRFKQNYKLDDYYAAVAAVAFPWNEY